MTMLKRMAGGYLKRMGWWVLVYLAAKWMVLGGVVYWLSRYDWFELKYLAVLPVMVVSVLALKWILRRRITG